MILPKTLGVLIVCSNQKFILQNCLWLHHFDQNVRPFNRHKPYFVRIVTNSGINIEVVDPKRV